MQSKKDINKSCDCKKRNKSKIKNNKKFSNNNNKINLIELKEINNSTLSDNLSNKLRKKIMILSNRCRENYQKNYFSLNLMIQLIDRKSIIMFIIKNYREKKKSINFMQTGSDLNRWKILS